ncbi:hypothetical protein CPC08DRAFT_769562 [Agrocybe pediades]|nr:hypothetical protein CPC08DRAFT_769562 [Agrocybe pediades]
MILFVGNARQKTMLVLDAGNKQAPSFHRLRSIPLLSSDAQPISWPPNAFESPSPSNRTVGVASIEQPIDELKA